jgi:hypothetical protein
MLNVLSTGPAPALGVRLSDIGRFLVVERCGANDGVWVGLVAHQGELAFRGSPVL